MIRVAHLLVLLAAAAWLAACSRTRPTAIDLPGGEPGIGFDDLRYSERLDAVLVPAGRAGRIDLIDPATHAVRSIGGFSKLHRYTGGHDDGVTSVDDTGRFLLATDRTSRRLDVVDPGAGRIVAGLALAGSPDYVRWVPATGEAWITEPDRERIEIVAIAPDGAPRSVGEVEVPGGPESLVIDPVRGRAYTHLWRGATVAIDLRARAVVATWPNGCAGSRGIALDAVRGFLFAACREGKVVLLDAAGGGVQRAELARVVVGADVIDYRPSLRHLYIAGQESEEVAIIGVEGSGRMTVLGRREAVAGSHCVVGDGRGGVYVCDPDMGRILVRDDPYPASRE
jgi:hypothetical protein